MPPAPTRSSSLYFPRKKRFLPAGDQLSLGQPARELLCVVEILAGDVGDDPRQLVGGHQVAGPQQFLEGFE